MVQKTVLITGAGSRLGREIIHFFTKTIGSIVGTNLGIPETPNTYFKARIGLHYWGWATWADQWNQMQKNYDFLDRFILSDKYKQFVLAKNPFVNAFIKNRQTPKSWDLKWAMFQLSQNMRSIIPVTNLISNNGYTELATFTRIENSEFANIKRHHTDGNK